MDIRKMARECGSAAILLAAAEGAAKNAALERIAEAINEKRTEIINANRNDLARSEAEGVAPPLLKRLRFDDKKIDEAILGIQSLISIPDPVGRTLEAREKAENITFIMLKLIAPFYIF